MNANPYKIIHDPSLGWQVIAGDALILGTFETEEQALEALSAFGASDCINQTNEVF